MNWHKKMIVRGIFAVLVSILMASIFLALVIAGITNDFGSGNILFIILLLFSGLMIYASIKQLVDAIAKKREANSIDVLSDLEHINKYGSPIQLYSAFNEQRHNSLYLDDKIIITNDFFVNQKSNDVFILDGILDVVPFVQKVNGIIEYVSLIFLYYDGKRYEIKYRRPLKGSNMQGRINNISTAANIIANNSENFRKYPSYRLTD